jgi:hypothetical protein
LPIEQARAQVGLLPKLAAAASNTAPRNHDGARGVGHAPSMSAQIVCAQPHA